MNVNGATVTNIFSGPVAVSGNGVVSGFSGIKGVVLENGTLLSGRGYYNYAIDVTVSSGGIMIGGSANGGRIQSRIGRYGRRHLW